MHFLDKFFLVERLKKKVI